MNTHGIEVFNSTNDNAVIVFIANHFHLVLFPANQRLINKQLIGRRKVKTAGTDFIELVNVVCDTATGSTHGERRTDDTRETDAAEYIVGLLHRVSNFRTGTFQTDRLHRFIKALTVFRFIDSVSRCTNQFNVELFQYAFTLKIQRTVQCSLAAHGRQYHIRTFFFDDFAYHFPVNRLDVGSISHFRVGHDSRRVRVYQNDAVTLFAQCLTGLCAGIVKFTGLADNDRAGTQNQNTFYVSTFWHCRLVPTVLIVQ